MAKKLISFNFNGEFCDELSSLSLKYDPGADITAYCTTPPARMTHFTTETYLAELIANYLGQIRTMHLFVGKTAKNEFVCEYQKYSSAGNVQVCIGSISSSGAFEFKAGELDDDGLLCSYQEGHKGSMFVAAMMPLIERNSEAASKIDVLKNYTITDDYYSEAMCGITNHIYYRVKDEKSLEPVRYDNEPKKLTQSNIDSCSITTVYCGEPKIFNRVITASSGEDSVATSFGVSSSELRDMFILNDERELTDEEERRVPKLDNHYVVPTWAIKTAKRIQRSTQFRKGINNILLYGPSGTGKTEGSQAIAEMLGLPYYSITCSADDDKFDILGQLVPNVNKSSAGGKKPEDMCAELNIPTFDEVEFDYEGAFEKLFKRKPTKLDTPSMCYEAITTKLLDSKNGSENDFVFVESELIQAIKNGGFCEIQEANIIKQSSVMEALNPLLADSGENSFIKLQTGEIIHRHPDCIIAFTVNRDYEGCNNLQEAVYSRINYIKQIPEPTEEELFNRTKAQTGFSNNALLRKMAKCVAEIHEYCKEKDITSGVCGPRELLDWAQVAILESDEREEEKISETSVIAAALDTVLEKVSQNEDDIEDVTVGVFKKHFSPAKVDELRAS